MNSGIYAIANIESGKAYIGSTVNLGRRWRQHQSCLRRGVHDNTHLQHSWDKYGKAAFEFIVCEYMEDKGRLHVREQYWLDWHRLQVEVYNCGTVARNPMLGKTHTPETRARLSARIVSEETRRRMSGIAKKRTPSEETRHKISAALKGKAVSEETRRRMSEAGRLRVLSEEAKHNLNMFYPAFINWDTGEVIPAGDNLTALCRSRGFPHWGLRSLKSGKYHAWRGWTLESSMTPPFVKERPYPAIYNRATGEVVPAGYNKKALSRRLFGEVKPGFKRMLKGDSPSYKDWVLLSAVEETE